MSGARCSEENNTEEKYLSAKVLITAKYLYIHPSFTELAILINGGVSTGITMWATMAVAYWKLSR